MGTARDNVELVRWNWGPPYRSYYYSGPRRYYPRYYYPSYRDYRVPYYGYYGRGYYDSPNVYGPRYRYGYPYGGAVRVGRFGVFWR